MFLPKMPSGWLKSSLAILALAGMGAFDKANGQSMGSSSGSSMGSSGSGSFGGGGSSGSSGSNSGGQFLNQQMDVTKFTNWTSSYDTSSGSRGGSSNGVGSTSILGKSFKSTLGQGMASGQSNSSSFGNPIYNTSTSGGGAGGAGGARGGTTSRGGGRTSTMGGMGGGAMGRSSGSGMGGNATSFAGMSNSGTSRVAAYLTEPIFDVPQKQAQAQGIVSPRAQAEIQEVLSRSPRFQGDNAITVSNDGPAVVLRGKVANAREKRIAESMARLTPGVRQVVNELEVAGSPE